MGDSIDAQVTRIVAEVLGVPPHEVRLESKIFDDLGADSLTAEDILQALEKSFGVSIPPEAASEVETVRDLIDQVKRRGGRRA